MVIFYFMRNIPITRHLLILWGVCMMLLYAYVFGIFLLILGIAAYITGIRFLIHCRNMKLDMLKKLEKFDKQVKRNYNKIAALSVFELDNYLGQIYSICLDLAAAEAVSNKDPNAAVILYAKSLEKIQLYLGEDTITALDYFYGKDYLIHWCETRYSLLNTKKVLNGIIERTQSTVTIKDAMDTSNKKM